MGKKEKKVKAEVKVKKEKKEKKVKAEVKEKKVKKEKKEKTKTDVSRIKGTVIPVAFSDFVEKLEVLGEVVHKGTVSNVKNDDGVFVTVPKQGSSEDKVSLFFNKSRGWKPEGEYPSLEIDTWHTGDVRAVVNDSKKATAQAYKLCKEWMKAIGEHKPSGKVSDSKDAVEAKSNGEDKPKKKKKKSNGEDKAKSKVKSNGESKPKKKKKKSKKSDSVSAEA